MKCSFIYPRFLPFAAGISVALIGLASLILYVFSSPGVSVNTHASRDLIGHLVFVRYVIENGLESVWGFRDSYTWFHHPAFYRLNAVIAKIALVLGAQDARDIQAAWAMQGVFGLVTAGVIAKMCRLYISNFVLAAFAAVFILTMPRVFLSQFNWSQNVYILMLVSVHCYALCSGLRHGFSLWRLIMIGATAGLGFNFKITMVIVMAISFCVLAYHWGHSKAFGKGAYALLLLLVIFVSINWEFLVLKAGRDRLILMPTYVRQYYENRKLNEDKGIWSYTHIEPAIFYDTSLHVLNFHGRKEKSAAVNGAIVGLFEPPAHQAPQRTWASLVALWIGSLCLLWGGGKIVRILLGVGRNSLGEVYLALLVSAAAAGYFWVSGKIPFGWMPSADYVLWAYAPALIILFKSIDRGIMAHSRLAWAGLGIVFIWFAANIMLVGTSLGYLWTLA